MADCADTDPHTGASGSGAHCETLEVPNPDDQTCVSSVTGFDFELYPESGMMYPSLESVPSDVSSNTASMPRANTERTPPLPVLHEVRPHGSGDDDLESPMRLKTLEHDTDHVASRKAPASVSLALIPVAKLDDEKAKSSDQPNLKAVQEHPTTTKINGAGPAKIPNIGLDQQILEEGLQGIQTMPSSPNQQTRPNQQNHPGAYAVEGINARHEVVEENRPDEEGHQQQQQQEQDEEEEVQVHEAHLVVAGDDDPESAIVPPARTGEEVLEAQTLKSQDEQRENGQGKPFVWCLLATCFLAALVLLLVFLVGPANDKQEEDNHLNATENLATIAPAFQYPPFLDDLPIEVITGIEEKVDSPFYKANLWIWNDPNMDSYTPERLKQRFYLAMMYYATNGDGWLRNDNWLSYGVSECDWFSQSTYTSDSKYYESNACDDINGTSTVINLSLASNNLTGSWPINYYVFMPLLRILDLGNNHIGGGLPTLTGTPYTEVFILSNNPLVGPLRLNAGAFFDSIKVIRMDGTQTRGNNGGVFYHVLSKGMEVLNVTGQPNDGQIWPELAMLTNLEYYGQGHTNITGTIPTELGLMTALKQLDLSSLPYLSGTIPSVLGLLTDLTLLDLTETPLTGTVPEQLCDRVNAGLLEIPANCSSLQCCNDI